jgi:hypothetical protein
MYFFCNKRFHFGTKNSMRDSYNVLYMIIKLQCVSMISCMIFAWIFLSMLFLIFKNNLTQSLLLLSVERIDNKILAY